MLKTENLMRMAEIRGQWCVSVYMPIKEPDAKKNRLHLRSLIVEAGRKLHSLNVEPFKIAGLLGPIELILQNAGFWKDRTEGFAAFFTPDSFAWHSMQYEFDELVVVTDRFHLKPLVRNASENGRFYLLALSKTQIKLFEASEIGIKEVRVKGIPQNPNYFLIPGTEEDSSLEDAQKWRLLELFQKVDKGVADYLKDEETPLVLAGTEELHPIYHEANNYSQLLKIGIGAESDKLPAKQLLEKALPIVKPVFRRRREKALRMFQENIGTGLASNNLAKIFKAARNGGIKTLFVPVGKQKWGTFNNQTDELSVHKQAKPGDKDLLCVAATRTLRGGGEVFVVLPGQMPDNSLIAAVLRN